MRRRTLLATTGFTAVAVTAAGIASQADATTTKAPARRSPLRTFRVEGADLSLDLLPGEAATVLLYVVRRFHYEIETLRKGDVVADPSGTAVDIRPGWYPAGVKGGFLPYQQVVIRDILAECDGLVRWGGDLAKKPQESRFALATAPAEPRLHALAGRMRRDGAGTPSRRVGADMARPFTAARIKRADAIRRQTAGK
jgi:hypothetical protein